MALDVFERRGILLVSPCNTIRSCGRGSGSLADKKAVHEDTRSDRHSDKHSHSWTDQERRVVAENRPVCPAQTYFPADPPRRSKFGYADRVRRLLSAEDGSNLIICCHPRSLFRTGPSPGDGQSRGLWSPGQARRDRPRTILILIADLCYCTVSVARFVVGIDASLDTIPSEGVSRTRAPGAAALRTHRRPSPHPHHLDVNTQHVNLRGLARRRHRNPLQ